MRPASSSLKAIGRRIAWRKRWAAMRPLRRRGGGLWAQIVQGIDELRTDFRIWRMSNRTHPAFFECAHCHGQITGHPSKHVCPGEIESRFNSGGIDAEFLESGK